MHPHFLKKKLPLAVLMWSASGAWAHEGHGAQGAHAHAFDNAIGFVGVLLAAGLWLWLRNKR